MTVPETVTLIGAVTAGITAIGAVIVGILNGLASARRGAKAEVVAGKVEAIKAVVEERGPIDDTNNLVADQKLDAVHGLVNANLAAVRDELAKVKAELAAALAAGLKTELVAAVRAELAPRKVTPPREDDKSSPPVKK